MNASQELVKIAASIESGEKRFHAIDEVTVWNWNTDNLVLESQKVPQAKARSDYALKTLKLAVAADPRNEVASDQFVKLATRNAIVKASFGQLADADPQLFAILAALPGDRLLKMLDSAIANKDTPVVLGVIQVIAVRSDPIAAKSVSRFLDQQRPRQSTRLSRSTGAICGGDWLIEHPRQTESWPW